MYIKKYIKIILILMAVFNGCNKPKSFMDATGYISYDKYLDGNIRSFDIISDTLFVASEDQGIAIYQINYDNNNKIILDSLHLSSEVLTPVTLEIAKNSRALIVLDDYMYTYIGKLDFFKENSKGSLNGVRCDEYQEKSTYIEYPDDTVELITPFRHLSTDNEYDEKARHKTTLHRVKFDQDVYDENGDYSGDCSDTLKIGQNKYLNYELEDVYYNNEKLYIANPDTLLYSVVILNHDLSDSSFEPIDTLVFDSKPLTVKTNDNYIFVGLDNNGGCYIKLLGTDDVNDSNFIIGSGYTIKDIQLSDDYITLSTGYSGSLIYKWNNAEPELFFLLGGFYSYKTVVHDDSNVIIGTKDGLYIYEIER